MQAATFYPLDLALTRPVRWLAAHFQQMVVFRALDAIASVEVRGAARVHALNEPCIFVANHSSHLDTPCVLRALPWTLRRRIAILAAADYWFSNPLVGALGALSFNLVPLQRTGSARGSLQHASHLLRRGWSLLIYPEGTRALNGQMAAFKPGAALLAVQHGVPIVPIRIEGAYEVLRKGQHRPQRGRVRVTLGEPLRFAADADYRAAIKMVEARVRAL